LDDDRFGGYIARKQTHIHKLAMILAASCHDRLVLSPDELSVANEMVTDLELDMPKVFGKIGRTDTSVQMERFLAFVQRYDRVPYAEAYRFIHTYFPGFKDFEDMLTGCIRANLIRYECDGHGAAYLCCPRSESSKPPPGVASESRPEDVSGGSTAAQA
jgi:hypothetical protein